MRGERTTTSDVWEAAYYLHDVVVHRTYFVHPLDHDGTSRDLFQSYLAEFTWRSWHRGETGVFEQFTECICEIYAI
jgi:hypothetical protein